MTEQIISNAPDLITDNIGKAKNEVKIGLWGTTGSGKTTYLTMLFHDVVKHEGFRIIPQSNEARSVAKENYRFIQEEHSFPPSTSLDELRIYDYQLLRDAQTKKRGAFFSSTQTDTRSVNLRLIDAGGQWYEEPHGTRAQYLNSHQTNSKDDPVAEFAKSDVIVVLLDITVAIGTALRPIKERRKLFTALENFFEVLSECGLDERGFVRQPIAFCASKVDIVPAWPYRDSPLRLIQEFFPREILSLIVNYCHPEQREFFCISSIGVVKNSQGRGLSPIDEDNRIEVNAENITPYNLLKPIGWLAWKFLGDKSFLPDRTHFSKPLHLIHEL